ncbi:YigZ family protein [Petroclostridium sp. X23]|uniref:YigZ family protein n=1 Tax=Petroclostridium sp. X23 TaxID=3045146 RepID=UPI0024ADB623|nr:YigZ family protein [Petroclostridium sp. X23]WHH60732.1 YigZ family protein [Petroclostridium sp. X23]
MRGNQQTEYKTVNQFGTAEIVEKKSRFIASVKPVATEEEALEFIAELKSKYWDARHNVYAYIIGDNHIQRYSDDGEPSGTAGIPVLEIIKKEQLQDVAVVVTRYFGGTLLGAGGLVRAYGKSAKEGLVAADIVTMKLCDSLKINADYTLLGKIQNEIGNAGHIIEEIVYRDDITIFVLVHTGETQRFVETMIDITNDRVNIEKAATKYIAVNEQGKLCSSE